MEENKLPNVNTQPIYLKSFDETVKKSLAAIVARKEGTDYKEK